MHEADAGTQCSGTDCKFQIFFSTVAPLYRSPWLFRRRQLCRCYQFWWLETTGRYADAISLISENVFRHRATSQVTNFMSNLNVIENPPL